MFLCIRTHIACSVLSHSRELSFSAWHYSCSFVCISLHACVYMRCVVYHCLLFADCKHYFCVFFLLFSAILFILKRVRCRCWQNGKPCIGGRTKTVYHGMAAIKAKRLYLIKIKIFQYKRINAHVMFSRFISRSTYTLWQRASTSAALTDKLATRAHTHTHTRIYDSS